MAGMALASAPPLESWTLAPDAIRDWASTAPAGAELVYARAWHLNRKSPGAMQARKLAELGWVITVQRGGLGELKDYVLQRLRPQRGVIGRPLKSKAPTLDGDMSRVLRVLRQCVKDGQPCPSNSELRKRAQVHNPSYALQKLADKKIVESVILDRATGARVVTILATDEKTALPAGWRA